MNQEAAPPSQGRGRGKTLLTPYCWSLFLCWAVKSNILVCADLFCTLLWFFKVPSREMKMFCVVFLLLTPGVCEDDDDDVKYISKRNSGRRTALDITWNISFCFQTIHLFVFYVPTFLFCSLYYCLAIIHFWTARFYPWWCSDELLM